MKIYGWPRFYNGLEYTYRKCQGEGCELYTWLHTNRCAMCELHDIKIIENTEKEEQPLLLSTMMDDCCLDN